MSCRVLGRGVEAMVLRELIEIARSRGRKRLVGVYRATERNGMVKDHYLKLGFEPLAGPSQGAAPQETWWGLSAAAETPSRPMTVRRLSADLALTP
jgi:predicted enzyme involved in methoxymalonyl-ACP biosynthesis